MAKIKDAVILAAAFGLGTLCGYRMAKGTKICVRDSTVYVREPRSGQIPKEKPIHIQTTGVSLNAKLVYGIAGIDQDGEGTVTFLPAFGRNYVREEKPPHIKKHMETPHKRCIHNHTWDEIIEMIRRDPHCFDGCLHNGCVKSMPLSINETLRSTGWTKDMYESETGDGPSALFREIADEFRVWQPGHGDGDFRHGDTAGGYPASRIRAVLNGYDGRTDAKRTNGDLVFVRVDENDPDSDWGTCSKSLTDIRKITRENCLLSCFPEEVQKAIIPKGVRCLVDGKIVIVRDKLWLPSLSEMYPNCSRIYKQEGRTYRRFCDPYTDKSVWAANGKSGDDWFMWLRSPFRSSAYIVYNSFGSGCSLNNSAYYGGYGLAPGFVIGKEDRRKRDN